MGIVKKIIGFQKDVDVCILLPHSYLDNLYSTKNIPTYWLLLSSPYDTQISSSYILATNNFSSMCFCCCFGLICLMLISNIKKLIYDFTNFSTNVVRCINIYFVEVYVKYDISFNLWIGIFCPDLHLKWTLAASFRWDLHCFLTHLMIFLRNFDWNL